MKPLASFLLIAYGIGVGVWAQKNEIPSKLGKAIQERMDTQTRHTADVMMEAVAKRKTELGMLWHGLR